MASTSYAHHSDSFYFIEDRGSDGGAIRIEGTVSRVRLINPHSEFFVEVENAEGGTDRWAIESDSWNELKRLGWTQSTVEQGDRVAIVVAKSKFHPTAGRLRDLLLFGAEADEPATLFLEYIPDASEEFGQSSAPLRILERAPQCPDTVQFDPVRERGEETLLCISLDGALLNEIRSEFADQLAILN
jgi:hypothetical protein